MVRLLIIILCLAQSGMAASWYINPSNVSGTTNGTSWATGWVNPRDVVWASVTGGDTVFVSGGTTTQVYTNFLLLPKDGTSDSSRITIRIGQDAGHNGIADFGTNTIDLGSTPFAVTLDGNRGLSYSNPTNWYQVRQGDWTNNIGFWFHDVHGYTSDDTSPVFAYWTEGTANVTVRYIRISGYTNDYSGTCCGNSGPGSGLDERGALFYGAIENDVLTNVVFEYVKLDHNSGRQFAFNSNTNNAYDGVHVRFSLIEYWGEDMFQVNAGWSIHDNVLGVNDPADVHGDMFQLTGGFFKVYNNLIREGNHSYLRMQSLASLNTNTPVNNHSILIFNNVHSELPGRGPYGGNWNEGWGFVHWDSTPANGGSLIWSNVWVVNNTFYGTESNTLQHVMRANPSVSWSTGATITNAWLYDIHYLNNVWVNQHLGMTFPGTNGAGSFHPYTTNDFEVNHNTMAGYNNGYFYDARKFGYNGVYTELDSHPFKFLNTTNVPVFIGATNEDFELSAGDIAALNTGTNLSAKLSGVFNFDSLNRARNIGGSWDRGALEFQETNLVVFLSFDNDTAGGNALDSSGNNYHGYTNFYSANLYPTNVTASSAGNTVFRSAVTGNAKDFKWHTNNATYGQYSRDGGSYAVTNINRLTNMSQATIMCWARYQPATRTDLVGADSSSDGNAALISAGTATASVGSWDLTRFNQAVWRNNTRFLIVTNSNTSTPQNGTESDRAFGKAGRLVLNFPDIGDSNAGDTTNWYHYAVTFSNGVVKSYYNASAWTTNDISAITNKLHIGRGAARPYDYIGIGVDTHVGTPEYENETGIDYPNNGFMNGAIDQVRIYDRALSWQEIVDVANSEGAAFADAPTESGGGGSTYNAFTIGQGVTLRNGATLRP